MLKKFFALLILSGTVLLAADDEQELRATSSALVTFEQSWHPGGDFYYNPTTMPTVGEILSLAREKFSQNGSVGIVFDGNGTEGVLSLVCNSHDGSVSQSVSETALTVKSDVPFSLSAADGLATLSGCYNGRAALDLSVVSFDANTGMLKFNRQAGYVFRKFAINNRDVVAAVFFLHGNNQSLTVATVDGKLSIGGIFNNEGIAIEAICESAALAFKAPVIPQQVVAASADVPSVQLFSQ